MIIIKSEAEIAKMRVAGQVAARVRDILVRHVRPGVTTRELDALAEETILALGAVPSFKGYRGYPASICTSVNEEVVHGLPGSRRLREGDIVSIDLGVIVDGYHGDTAVTVPVGYVSRRVRRLLEVTREALFAGIAQAREGCHLSDVSHAVEETVRPHGYGIVREYVGHGIGRSMHEDPQVANYGPPGQGIVLRRGIVLAIEPMVNLGTGEVRVLADGWTVVAADGLPSAHFEHTVAVGEEPEVLTRGESL